MMKNRLLAQLTLAVVALLIGNSGFSAPQNPDTVITFLPIDLVDEQEGAKVQEGSLTYKGARYEVKLNGLGVGGGHGKGVMVIGEVYGLANIADLEGTYISELAQDQTGRASSVTLRLDKNTPPVSAPLSIILRTANPKLSFATGSDEVTVRLIQGK